MPEIAILCIPHRFLCEESVYNCKINDIQNIIKAAAAKTNCYAENGNTALQAQQSVNEPVIPLPNAQPPEAETSSVPTTYPTPEMLRQFIKSNFRENRDFMRIAGIPKPLLTKEGSMKILRYMGYRPVPRLISAVFDSPEGVVSYTFEVTLVDKEGSPVVSAVGAASSAEKKFASLQMSAINTVCNMAYKRALTAVTKLLF